MTPNQRPLGPAQPTLAVPQQPNVSGRAQPVEEFSNEGIVVYLRIVVRHRWTVMVIATAGLLAGFFLTLPQTPVYQAHASLEVQGLNENFLNFQNLNPTAAPGGYVDPSYEILTEVQVLKSWPLMDRTVRAVKKVKPATAAPSNRFSAWRRVFHWTRPQVMDRDQAISMAATTLTVKASGTTRIIDITCDSTDSEVAAGFVNTLLEEFIQKNLEDRWNTTERTGQWLTGQLSDLKVRLERSEDALQSYAASVGLQFTSKAAGTKDAPEESVADAGIRHLQEDLLRARVDRMALESKYQLVSSSPPEAPLQILDEGTLGNYQGKLLELRSQLAELRTSFTPSYPKVQDLQAQINVVEASLKTERANLATRLRDQFAAAQQHENLLNAEFEKQLARSDSQASKEVHYNILKREVETNRQLYESLLQKVKESSITAAMRASNFQVVAPARAPRSPYKPSLINNTLLGLLAGMFVGVLFVLLREQSDRNIQQPGDSSLYLGVSEVGVIPAERRGALGRVQASTAVQLRDGEHVQCLELITWQRQRSLIAECFRTVLTSIMFTERDAPRPRVFVIASPNPSEGKTTIASNLAIALAEINQRVLLVDADMRRPRLHRVLNLANNAGLSNLLQEKRVVTVSKLQSVVQNTWIPNLYLLSSGPSVAAASTLFYSARLPEIVLAARESFDSVIIDTPPMLHISDARLLARQADAVLLVLRAGKTTRAAAIAARQKFAADSSNLLGTVLTDWNPDQNGYGYNYKYYARHAAYYTHQEMTNGTNRSATDEDANEDHSS
jgi:succinoglycan biosynthesis transport protein ExoP